MLWRELGGHGVVPRSLRGFLMNLTGPLMDITVQETDWMNSHSPTLGKCVSKVAPWGVSTREE